MARHKEEVAPLTGLPRMVSEFDPAGTGRWVDRFGRIVTTGHVLAFHPVIVDQEGNAARFIWHGGAICRLLASGAIGEMLLRPLRD